MRCNRWQPSTLAVVAACLLAPCAAHIRPNAPPTEQPLTIWYDKPASAKSGMNEALPIGNSRIGGMIFGEPAAERLVLNEDSLWTGDDNPTGDYAKIGIYQMLGDLLLHLPSHQKATGYRRQLKIGQAIAGVYYQAEGVTYRREYFCSHPEEVLVVRLTADKPGMYTGSVQLNDAHGTKTTAQGQRLAFSGALANGLKYEAQLAALHDGGSLTAVGSQLDFTGCDSLTFLVVAGTDYVMDHAKGYRGEPPHARLTRQLDTASAKPYEVLKSDHVRDYQSLFNRVSLDLGPTPAERRAQPTDRRKVEASRGGDPELEAFLFQYGRYLMISCSRRDRSRPTCRGYGTSATNRPGPAITTPTSTCR